MAVLTTKGRKHMKQGTFALPGKRYPINDKAHAANAKARATQEVAKGKLTPEEAASIRHKANSVLGETDSAYHNA
jgi:hypothetical protein